MTLDEIADELYALAPQQFTAARDGFAREVQGAGDRQLAAGIRRLRRPTRGAWLVNLLARERAPELAELLALGEALRATQAGAVQGGSAGDLRTLGDRRRTAVRDLVAAASRLAQTQALPPTEAVLAEVSGTLEAATADAAIGAAVSAGQLVAAISYAGFGELPDLATLTALPGGRAVATSGEPAQPAKSTKSAQSTQSTQPAQRAQPAQPAQPARSQRLAQAQQDARATAGLADDAQRGYEQAETALERARDTAGQAAALEATVREQLGAATTERRSADLAVQAAEEAVRAAAQQARQAHRAADAARRALAKATGRPGQSGGPVVQ